MCTQFTHLKTGSGRVFTLSFQFTAQRRACVVCSWKYCDHPFSRRNDFFFFDTQHHNEQYIAIKFPNRRRKSNYGVVRRRWRRPRWWWWWCSRWSVSKYGATFIADPCGTFPFFSTSYILPLFFSSTIYLFRFFCLLHVFGDKTRDDRTFPHCRDSFTFHSISLFGWIESHYHWNAKPKIFDTTRQHYRKLHREENEVNSTFMYSRVWKKIDLKKKGIQRNKNLTIIRAT